MGKRYWAQVPPWREHHRKLTDAEVLAEMPTETLVDELRRRGFQPHGESGGWSTVVVDSESWQEYVEGLKAIDD